MDEKLLKFINYLLTPPPYRIFCDKLHGFNQQEFIQLISDLFEALGCQVTPGPKGPDETIDLMCETGSGNYTIQCKKWRWDHKVKVKDVREVYGAAVKHKAAGVLIVTTSDFTENARQFSYGLEPPRVGFIDGKQLFDLMKQHLPDVVSRILNPPSSEANRA